MKKSIIYLGIFATMLVNTSFAKEVESDQQNPETEVSKMETKSEVNATADNNLSKPIVNLESENKMIESISVISAHYKKSIKEIIEEDKNITENQEELYQPLLIEPSIEEHIKLDSQIIESTINNNVYPIDFELINQSNKMSNNFDLKSKEAYKS